MEELIHQKGFKLPPEQEKDWISTMARRMRVLARHVSQARIKSPGAPWVLELECRSDQGEGTTAASSDTKKDQEYFYGFDREHFQGWRCVPGSKDKKLSSSVFEPEACEEHDAVLAKWDDDGHIASIADCTVGELRARLAMMAEKKGRSSCSWSKVDVAGSRFHVALRKDRDPLISLYKNGSQVLQVRQSLFTTVSQGEEMMRGLGEKLASGRIALEDLQKERDLAMGALGLAHVKKRPACCSFDSAAKGTKKLKAKVKGEKCVEHEDSHIDQVALRNDELEQQGSASTEGHDSQLLSTIESPPHISMEEELSGIFT